MRHGLFCRQYRNSVWRFEPSTLGGAEKTRCFLTREPPAQKKSIILGRATLRRRKNRRYVCRNAPSTNAQIKKAGIP